jgi:hypothetical protein
VANSMPLLQALTTVYGRLPLYSIPHSGIYQLSSPLFSLLLPPVCLLSIYLSHSLSLALCLAVCCHHCNPVYRRDTQPDQLCVLHQLPLLWSHHRRPALLPMEEAQTLQTN